MKILYDYQSFSIQKYGGVSRVYVDIINSLKNDYNIDIEVSAKFSNNYYAGESKLFVQNKFFSNFSFRGKIRLVNLLNKIFSRKKLLEGDYDVFHATYYDPYYIKHNNKPSVIVIHDMINEIFPDLFSKRNNTSNQKRIVLQDSDHIIAISHNTKKDIMNFFPEVDEKKISVIHHGYSNDNKAVQEIVNLPKKYILYVGQRGLYKNFDLFVNAIHELLQGDVDLICAGGLEFSDSELEIFKDLNILTKVKRLSPSDAELNFLYQNALCFVFPSLYEGFGLPILEAFANNCPILLSDIDVFREIVDDAGMYFDPKDKGSIEVMVSKMINSPKLRDEYSANGNEMLNEYLIEDTAKKYLDVYIKLLQT